MMIAANLILSAALQTGDPNQFNGFMILGYVAMWLVVMVYLITISNRQRNVKEEVELLEQLLREDEEAEK
jgi:CcmD family protein